MQGSMERRRLLQTLHTEPVQAHIVLVKCAAGLAAVALTSVIGLRAPISSPAPALTSANVAAAAARANARSRVRDEANGVEVKYQSDANE